MAMAMKFLVAFAALAVAGLTLQTTEAATYVVGDSFGWQTPPNSTFYNTWASSKTFRVGDVLVFNFTTGADDVARVRTQENFNDCDDDVEDIITRATTGPANFTLDTAGMYYFISTIDRDNNNNNDDKCERGQRLSINVVAASTTPATPPTTTPVAPTPPRTTPAPPTTTTTRPTVYVVGDSFGWQTPPNNTFYSNWASSKTFRVGDILTFNFTTGADDVAMVRTLENFNDCDDDTEDIISRYTTGPANVTLNATGTYYFISTVDNDNNNNNDDKCERGQRVAITVVAASATPAPPTTTPSTPPTTPANPTVHVVGDSFGWQTPPNNTFYNTWASTRTFAVGDVLVFNFTTGTDDVARVRTQENFNDCDDDTEDIIARYTTGPANFTLDTTGMYYFISTIDNDNNNNSDDKCERGQRLSINVVAASTTPGATPSTPGSTPGAAFSPNGAPAVPGSAASFAANGALAMALSAAMFFI